VTGKRTLWRLFSSYLIITVVALLALLTYAFESYKDSHLRQVAGDLQISAVLAREQFQPLISERAEPGPIDTLCKRLGDKTGIRLTVIAESGQVLGDSAEDPIKMDNHRDRPEVLEALASRIGQTHRYSQTLGRTMTYIALPIPSGGKSVEAVLRASVPITRIEKAQRSFYLKIGIGGVVVALIAALISLFLARRISQPLEVLKQGAENLAKGKFDDPLQVTSTLEMSGLAEAMNTMAAQLKERIRTIEEQRYELQALLASMAEGVVAVDKDTRVLSFNHAAAEMFGLNGEAVVGRPIRDLKVNEELKSIVEETLREEKSLEAEFESPGPPRRYLTAHGSPWTSVEGDLLGGVVVVADVTRLRTLEKVRAEFVSNVSHELKTPITAIKGYIETLMDSTTSSEKERKKFLKIVRKQSNRLDHIIDDLLALSRLEHSEHRIRLETGSIGDVLEAVVDTCRPPADENRITLIYRPGPPLFAQINPALLEQAVVNLVDNAIKYSGEGKAVTISADRSEATITITVSDTGIGIQEKHLDRLFERFYRVDKGRSRKLGGTGLGLAIVKYIAKIHRGTVSVKSRVEEGSQFTISIPAEDG
jgi:two-component system phosphate regulon sensor histidine kinase PhoR